MRRSIVVAALVPLLMASTAGALAADPLEPTIIPTEESVFTLTGTFGIVGFQLPTFDTGAFGHTAGGTLFGGMIGANVTATLGQTDDLDVLLRLAGFGAFGTGSSSWTDTFTSANSAVIVTGLSAPGAGSITLTPGAGASTLTVVGAGGTSTGVVAAAGTTNVSTVSADGTGFIFGSAVTTPTTGAAYGGIGASSGGIFIASGDIDGLSITTNVQRNIFYGGADLTLGLAGDFDGQTSAQGYVGPSYRGLVQNINTRIAINIPEALPSALTHPEFSITVADTLTSNYFGGVLGGNLSFETSPDMTFTLGLEGGVYSVNASWRGQDTYATCCGAVGAPITSTSPTLSVQGPAMTSDLGSTIAFAARGNAAVTFALEGNKALTFGGNVEYLSQVAAVNHSGLTQTGAVSDDWVAGTPIPAATTFSWGSMINYAATVSLTGTF